MTGTWIEFFGPPGVGKTTTFELVARKVELPLRRQIPQRPGALDRLLAGPAWRAFNRHVLDAFGRCPRGLSEPRLRTYRSRMTRTAAARETGGLWLFDDWLCQRGQSLAAARAPWADIERFFDVMPLPAGLVVLTAEADEIKRRNRERRRAGKPDLGGEVDQALRVVDAALPRLRARGAHIIEINASEAKRDIAAQVETFLAETQAIEREPA